MWWHLIGHSLAHASTASETAQTVRVVHCEICGQYYAYELKRTGHGEASTFFGGGHRVASQRAAEKLEELLAIGIEVIPCPACDWYQSNMIPKARRLHRRWMIYVGQCLTIGLIPLAIIGSLINGFHQHEGKPGIPWWVFGSGLVGLLFVGVGMFVWKYNLARIYDPNDEDTEARKLYGQSRATLLSDQEAKDLEKLQELQ